MTVWDVAARPAGEQFGYWREVICEAFVPLSPAPRRDTDGFSSRVETRPLARVMRARIASQPQRTSHGAAEVARTDGEYVFVNLQTAGTCAVEQGGRRSLVRAGQFTVVDTASPYHFEFDEPWGMVSFRVPHALLGGRLETARRLAGGCWDASGTGAVVAAVMSSMWDLDATGAPGSRRRTGTVRRRVRGIDRARRAARRPARGTSGGGAAPDRAVATGQLVERAEREPQPRHLSPHVARRRRGRRWHLRRAGPASTSRAGGGDAHRRPQPSDRHRDRRIGRLRRAGLVQPCVPTRVRPHPE